MKPKPIITRRAFENTREMQKTRAAGEYFYISLVFSNAPSCFITRVLIHGLGFFICFFIMVMWRKKDNKNAFSTFHTLINTWVFLQSERAQVHIYLSIRQLFILPCFECFFNLFCCSRYKLVVAVLFAQMYNRTWYVLECVKVLF